MNRKKHHIFFKNSIGLLKDLSLSSPGAKKTCINYENSSTTYLRIFYGVLKKFFLFIRTGSRKRLPGPIASILLKIWAEQFKTPPFEPWMPWVWHSATVDQQVRAHLADHLTLALDCSRWINRMDSTSTIIVSSRFFLMGFLMYLFAKHLFHSRKTYLEELLRQQDMFEIHLICLKKRYPSPCCVDVMRISILQASGKSFEHRL